MGFEIEVFKIGKIKNKVFDRVDMKESSVVSQKYGNKLLFFTNEEYNNTDPSEGDIKDLKPYLTEVCLFVHEPNIGLIKKDYHVPSNYEYLSTYISSSDSDGKGNSIYSFFPKDYMIDYTAKVEDIKKKRMEVTLSKEEDSAYQRWVIKPFWVCSCKLISHWVSRRDLSDDMHFLYKGTISNTGYHKTNKKMRKELKKNGAKISVSNKNIFYLESY